jgi:hypothetical protein
MRLTLLATILLVSLHTCLATVPAFASLPVEATHATSLSSKPVTAALGSTFPKPHLRFKERRGTMGFVYAVCLGPVGYFGVKVFSGHNEMMCYQAARGFKIWGMLVISCALLAAAAALKDNGDSVTNLLTVLWANP